jgi:hypothetical protein
LHAQVSLIVKLTGATAVTDDAERVGELERDLDVKAESDGEGVKTWPKVGGTSGNAREHDVSVGAGEV